MYETLKKSKGQIDLRSLITNLLEKSDEDADLDKILQNVKTLFQKNLIDIQLNLSSTQENE